MYIVLIKWKEILNQNVKDRVKGEYFHQFSASCFAAAGSDVKHNKDQKLLKQAMESIQWYDMHVLCSVLSGIKEFSNGIAMIDSLLKTALNCTFTIDFKWNNCSI